MKTITSEKPDMEAAQYISDLLATHNSESILLVLSGGSALSVLSHIREEVLGSHIVVTLADDRFTTKKEGNTFMQLEQTPFFTIATKRGVSFINSIPKDNESPEQFKIRIEMDLDSFLAEHPTHYAIGLLGIGEDGHTASIFPLTESEFSKNYSASSWYIQSKAPNTKFAERITITPSFIEDILDEVVLYAVGENKCSLILETLHSNKLQPNQLPALIPAQHPHSVLFTDCIINE